MLKLTILLGAVVFYVAFGQKTREITAPDMIRNVYMKLDKTLWEKDVNKVKSQNEQLKKIYIEHSNFISTFLTESINIDNLKSLIEYNGWHHLSVQIVNIHQLFGFFRQHIARETKNSDKDSFNEETSLDLSEHILNDSNWPLKESLQNLFKVTLKEKLYIESISMKFTCQQQRKVQQQSVQQVLYQLYNALAVVETEAFMMMQWAHMIRTVYQKGDSSSIANLLRNEFEEMIVKCLQKSVEIFEKADRSVWRCDPDHYFENSTYLQITKLLQGHIENEQDLNGERSCDQTCDNFQFTKEFGCSEKSICRRQSKCKGKILNCGTVEDRMWVCPGSEKSSRRYEYVVYDNERVLGEAKHCEQTGYHVSIRKRMWL